MGARLDRWLAAGLGALAVAAAGAVHAADAPPAGSAWSTLSATQKQALAPLQRDWSGIDAQRKQKWLEVANRFASMPDAERARVNERMVEWARMSPSQRTRARLQFQEARQVPLDERRARWEAYQNLSTEERQALALRAKRNARPSAPTPAVAPVLAAKPALPLVAAKRGLQQAAAPASAAAAPPTVLRQARPGATTTTLSTRAAPPLHHQAGLPKIAATPGFVDPATLLPKRGPQGAAARPVASRDPQRQP